MRYTFELEHPLSEKLLASFPELHYDGSEDGFVLRGAIVDQAHLFGVLNRIDAHGLNLIGLRREQTGTDEART